MSEWKVSQFGERLIWASAVGLIVTLSQFGADIRDGKVNWPRTMWRLCSFPMLAYVSALLASRINLVGEMNGMASILVFVIGTEGIERWARASFTRYTGIGETFPPSTPAAVPDPVTPYPASHPLADPRAVPIAQLGARFAADESVRAGPLDRDADLLGRIHDE